MKNKILHSIKIALPMVLALVALHVSSAQEEINIVTTQTIPGQAKPVPVSLEGFTGEVLEVLKFDLYVQGFSFVAPDAAQYRISGSSAAAANYAQVVKSVYEQAWTPPDDTASDDANIKVRVTIASDGTVVSAQVLDTSGDASVDRSVQNTLDRVQFIAPFPSGSTDKERTYLINFNLKSKRQML